jgi:hypothetical protein
MQLSIKPTSVEPILLSGLKTPTYRLMRIPTFPIGLRQRITGIMHSQMRG